MKLPEHVVIRELGLREGFQMHPTVVSTDQKFRLLQALVATGVSEIEVTSFVRPDRVPQLADAEALVQLLPADSETIFTALYLNERGFERAVRFPQLTTRGWIATAVSDTFLEKNAGTSRAKVLASVSRWCELFAAHGRSFHGILVSTAFGCAYEGTVNPHEVVDGVGAILAAASAPHRAREVCLADTVGLGAPDTIHETVSLLRAAFPELELALHVHDTRGTGMANAYAGLLEGVAIFECSVGGMGGCPFPPGAAGNLATEDFAYLCHRLGVSTGIDLAQYQRVALLAEEMLGRQLPGKFMRSSVEPPRTR